MVSVAGYRVQYLKTKNQLACWEEEKIITGYDMRRTLNYLELKSAQWVNMAKRFPDKSGHSAYASGQAKACDHLKGVFEWYWRGKEIQELPLVWTPPSLDPGDDES
jgi:hypothetical protein